MMLKIAVVDDELDFIEMLTSKIIRTCNELELKFSVDKYLNGYDIIENYRKYHLIFLDIEMPTMNGLETANKINITRQGDEIPLFVFVTSHNELVFEALKCFPYTFIRKDEIKDSDRLADLFERVTEQLCKRSKTTVIRADRQDVVLKNDDIIYLEKYKNYTHIHTTSEKYVVKASLSLYEKILPKDEFIRCHEGYIINLNHICKISDRYLLVDDDVSIPMSRSRAKALKEAFIKRVVSSNGF